MLRAGNQRIIAVALSGRLKSSPIGMGGRGTSPKMRSLSGKSQDGICLIRVSSGPSPSPLFAAANPSRATSDSDAGATRLDAELGHFEQ
jgi:hypothetical protein